MIELVKLIIQTAREELYPGETPYNFKIKQFENTPLLHKLLVEQISLENYCIENHISRRNAMLNIRRELILASHAYPKNTIVPESISF